MIQTEKPLTKKELAKFVNVSNRFIELEVARGRLRAVKFSDHKLRLWLFES
jgi:hypothetical protein